MAKKDPPKAAPPPTFQNPPQPKPNPAAGGKGGGSNATPAVAGPAQNTQPKTPGSFAPNPAGAAGASMATDLMARAAAAKTLEEANKLIGLAEMYGKASNALPANYQKLQDAIASSAAGIRGKFSKPPAPGPTNGGDNNQTLSASLAAYAPPPNPTPVLPVFTEDKTSTFKNVKVAPKDTVVFNESDVNIALMEDLLFEDIAAIELANMSRYDLIDGQEVFYSPIRNLSTIKRRFDPNNIIATAINNKTSYAIDLNSRIGSGTYEGKTKGVPSLDNSGNVFFYIDGLKPGEIVEIQLVSSGTIDEIGD